MTSNNASVFIVSAVENTIAADDRRPTTWELTTENGGSQRVLTNGADGVFYVAQPDIEDRVVRMVRGVRLD